MTPVTVNLGEALKQTKAAVAAKNRKARYRRYYYSHPNEVKERKRAYYLENREGIRENNRAYYYRKKAEKMGQTIPVITSVKTGVTA